MPQNACDLRRLFFERCGKLSDKWEQYLGIYERELGPIVARGVPLDLLEIGVQNGGSLETWASYLVKGSTITGIDVDRNVGNLTFSEPSIQTIILDATDKAALDLALNARKFDIIIDDGSHVCSDVILSFLALFDRLRPGGLFIIEDLHASYFASHQGGYRAPNSSIEFLKDFIDILHVDYFEDTPDEPTAKRLQFERLNRQIARVAFYDSVAVVEKLKLEKTQPYRRIFSGEVGEVFPFSAIANALPTAQLGALLASETTAQKLIEGMRASPFQNSVEALVEVEIASLRQTLDTIQSRVALATPVGMFTNLTNTPAKQRHTRLGRANNSSTPKRPK